LAGGEATKVRPRLEACGFLKAIGMAKREE
jgi:hypothetical protein